MNFKGSRFGIAFFLCWILNSGAGMEVPLAKESDSIPDVGKEIFRKELAQIDQGGIGRPLDLNRPIRNDSKTGSEDSIPSPNSLEESMRSFNERPGLGAKFEGIWGLTDTACENTRSIADISDDRTLAIVKNRIILVDSQCLILETKGDFTFGQIASVRCTDIDGQKVETQLKLKPIGALKLEISSANQNARQYVYCAGVSN